jgi:hypothetical protein
MQPINRRKKIKSYKPKQWPISQEPTLVVIGVDGSRTGCYSIHRETFLRNPETNECLRMQAWYNVSLWPEFLALDEDEELEYTLVFPPLPSHWQSFDLWEMSGSKPMYKSGIRRNSNGVYLLSDR